jgi:asparagine synthase (glutamine-hydrolysing)
MAMEKMDEHLAGTKNNRLLIWSLLSFEWWLKTFLP